MTSLINKSADSEPPSQTAKVFSKSFRPRPLSQIYANSKRIDNDVS